MSKSPVARHLKRGGIYRDLDGRLVCLVKLEHDLCTWTSLSEPRERETSHRENFLRRFRSLAEQSRKFAA